MSKRRNSKILIVFYILTYLKSWLVVQNLRIALIKTCSYEDFNQSDIDLFFSDTVWIVLHKMFSNFLLYGSWLVAMTRILLFAEEMEYLAI